MPKTPLFNRQQPGGFDDFLSFDRHPGNIWFVGSAVTGSSNSVGTGYGYGPDAPFATLVYALTQCTASQGDVIYLLPGHIETVGATALTIGVAGVAIRGIGEGFIQPRISLTVSVVGGAILVTAASLQFENILFQADVEDVAQAITISASDCTFRNCRFLGDNANDHNALIWISDTAALISSITVEDCYFCDMDASNTRGLTFTGTGRQHVVRRNKFIGHWTSWAIGGAGAIVDVDVSDNYIYNVHAAADNGINLANATKGVMMNNRCSTGQASVAQMTAPFLAKCENYGGIIGDSNGLLEPATA